MSEIADSINFNICQSPTPELLLMLPVDDKADPVAVVACDTPCNFKLQQGCYHRCRRGGAPGDYFVDVGCFRPQFLKNGLAASFDRYGWAE